PHASRRARSCCLRCRPSTPGRKRCRTRSTSSSAGSAVNSAWDINSCAAGGGGNACFLLPLDDYDVVGVGTLGRFLPIAAERDRPGREALAVNVSVHSLVRRPKAFFRLLPRCVVEPGGQDKLVLDGIDHINVSRGDEREREMLRAGHIFVVV